MIGNGTILRGCYANKKRKFAVTRNDAMARDDGLVAPDVGVWAEDKHRLVSLYSTLFSSSMKAKWSRRIYVELYAGAGFSRIRGTSKFILGSPILALKVTDPFDKYVFCEERPNKLDALKVRARQIAPKADIAYVQGDCNKKTSEIFAEIPRGSTGDTALSLCFADPFDMGIIYLTPLLE
jgi:three-Cys-motif partner protein